MASSITAARSGYPKHLGSLQKRIGRRLTGKTLLDKQIAIDTRIEKIVDFCRLQDRFAILTGGHHRGFDTDPRRYLSKATVPA